MRKPTTRCMRTTVIFTNMRNGRRTAKVDRLLYAGNDLDKACELFERPIKHWPRIRLTIRQRTRVLQQWPAD